MKKYKTVTKTIPAIIREEQVVIGEFCDACEGEFGTYKYMGMKFQQKKCIKYDINDHSHREAWLCLECNKKFETFFETFLKHYELIY